MHEHRATENRLAGQAVTAASGCRLAVDIGSDLVEQFGMLVEPRRGPFEIIGDGVVNGLGIE